MIDRKQRITEKVLSLIDWLESVSNENTSIVGRSLDELYDLDMELTRRLAEIKLESFAAEQLDRCSICGGEGEHTEDCTCYTPGIYNIKGF